EADGGVVPGEYAWGGVLVLPQPGDELYVRAAVPVDAHRGRHVDDSFDQFRLFQLGHGVITALELLARQAVAWLQRRSGVQAGGGSVGAGHGMPLLSGRGAGTHAFSQSRRPRTSPAVSPPPPPLPAGTPPAPAAALPPARTPPPSGTASGTSPHPGSSTAPLR